MKKLHSFQSGFTLVETLVAIFILMLTIGALLTLTAGGYFSIRYAKNDIVAANLLQESLEYIRNTRDTASQTKDATWDNWFTQYDACDTTGNNSKKRCMINPYAQNTADAVVACRLGANPKGTCDPLIYFNDVAFYGYQKGDVGSTDKKPTTTSFVRYITMKSTGGTDPQLIVTATIDWMNGTSPKEVQQSIILTKWNLQ